MKKSKKTMDDVLRSVMFVNYTTTEGRVGSIRTTPETWQEDVAKARGLGWDVFIRQVAEETGQTIDLVRIRENV